MERKNYNNISVIASQLPNSNFLIDFCNITELTSNLNTGTPRTSPQGNTNEISTAMSRV